MFGRKPKPDPVGDICRLLIEEPFAWTISEERNTDNSRTFLYTHSSGVSVVMPQARERFHVALSTGADIIRVEDGKGGNRLREAVTQRAAVIATAGRVNLGLTARQLAKAVYDGNIDGVWPLVDYLLEHAKRPESE